jgi:peptidoglycan/LPS O-acetylase OafA/YrhL
LISERVIKALAIFSILALVVFILLMLFYAPIKPALGILNFGPLVRVGQISYGLYLWYWPVRSLSLRLMPDPTPVTEIAFWALTFIAAVLSFYLVERPFLRLKKRFSRARQRPAALVHLPGA